MRIWKSQGVQGDRGDRRAWTSKRSMSSLGRWVPLVSVLTVLLCVLPLSVGAASHYNDIIRENNRAECAVARSSSNLTDNACISACSLSATVDAQYTVSESGGELILNSGGSVVGSFSYLGELLSSLRDGATVELGCVTVDSLVIDGSCTLSGELTVRGGITVGSGAELTLRDIVLKVRDGVSVRGGELNVIGGSLTAERAAVSLTVSSQSRFLSDGASIHSRSSSALVIEKGQATVKSSALSSGGAAAVSNSATLSLGGSISLSGADADALTDEPIWLSDDAVFSDICRVRYLSAFERGAVTPCFYGMTEEQAASITLTDLNGAAAELRCFESMDGICSTPFAAVLRPFRVSYYLDGVSVGGEELLRGDIPSPPTIALGAGLTLDGWYCDDALSVSADMAVGVGGDAVYYAASRLEPIRFSLGGISTVYDGGNHILAFTSLTHPADGKFSYVWYNEEGSIVSTSSFLALRHVSDSGEYSCAVTFTSGSRTVSVRTPAVRMQIAKQRVPLPTVAPVVYSGYPLLPSVASSALYTYSAEPQINAGAHPISFTLTDSENYAWVGSDAETVSSSFYITQATNSWTSDISVNSIYFGAELSPAAAALFGTVRYVYSSDADGGYSPVPPTAVGSYYVRAVVDECDDWSGLVSEPVRFSILADSVVAMFVETMPSRTEYRAFELFDPDGLSLSVRYSSGRVETIRGSDVNIIYPDGDCLRARDGGVYAEYGGHRIHIPLLVSLAEYEFDISFTDSSVEFCGCFVSISHVGELPTGRDGVPLRATVSGGGMDVGSYTVTLHFSSDSDQYRLPEPMTALLTVTPRRVSARWGSTELVYDGGMQCPDAYYIDVGGRRIALTVSGGVVNATAECTATATCLDKNYEIVNDSIRFSVAKARYDMSGVYWSGGDAVYNGERHAVRLCGLPKGVAAVGYVNAEATVVGSYIATATLSFDATNYEEPVVPSFEWCIRAAEYDLSGFHVLGGDVVYSGMAQQPTVVGTIPAGLDGSTLGYRIDGSVTNVSDGIVTCTVNFFGNSGNYLLPEPMTVSIRVVPREIRVLWSSERFVYNGGIQHPSATAAECEIGVNADGCDAGIYYAIAVSLDPNYTVANSRLEYEIVRAANSWVTEPEVSDIFLGDAPRFDAAAAVGDAYLRIYSDEQCSCELEEIGAVGVYYALVCVDESRNYTAMCSGVLRFEVRAVVPVGLGVALRDGARPTAFGSIKGDLIITLNYNNGSSISVDSNDAVIIYLHGDSLRRADDSVTVEYGGYSVCLPVTVSAARYDMSSVTWENTDFVYDGEEKCPSLAGLPDGVSVVEYIGTGAVAGEYSVSAVLAFDSENYEQPAVSAVLMRIAKCPITPSFDVSWVYDGSGKHLPSSPIFYPTSDFAAINAGRYSVEVALYDSDNYCLTDSEAEVVILPRTVGVRLLPLELYMFESPDGFEYELTSGSVIDGDDLGLVIYESADRIYAYSTNPNYCVDVAVGSIHRLGRLSPILARVGIWTVFAIVVAAVLVIVVLLRSRRRAAQIYAMGVGRICHGERPRLISGALASGISLSADRAEHLLSNAMARMLIRRAAAPSRTQGRRSCIVNVDTLSKNFEAGEVVDIVRLKEKGLVPRDAGRLRILGRGEIDKPLIVYADHFSLGAVKMIVLTGGEVNRVTPPHRLH